MRTPRTSSEVRAFVRLAATALLCAALPAQAALNIFACEPEWGALATEIGGERVAVYTATTALQDPHRIEARPSLIAAYRRADLLICTGADLELGWLPALAQKGNNPAIRPGQPGYLEAAASVQMLEIPATVDRSMGDVHPYGNPHLHLDPANLGLVAATLAERLSALDADGAAAYAAQLADFEQRWSAAIVRWTTRAAPLRGRAVVSAHKGWPYLYQWLGLREVAVLEAKPGVPPSTGHLKGVLESLERTPATMVLYAAYQSDRSARWLSKRAGIPAVELPFTVGGAKGTDDLFGLFEVTLDRLLAALGGR